MTKFQLIFASPPTPVPIEAASVQLTRGNVGLGGAGGGTSRRLPLSTSSNPSIMASIPLKAITACCLAVSEDWGTGRLYSIWSCWLFDDYINRVLRRYERAVGVLSLYSGMCTTLLSTLIAFSRLIALISSMYLPEEDIEFSDKRTLIIKKWASVLKIFFYI